MKNFKVGDTVKVDMQITQIESGLYKLERNGNVYWTSDDILKRQEQDKTYDDGLNDAWEVCRRIMGNELKNGFSLEEIKNIFGDIYAADIICSISAQDAIDKIKAWEDANAIRVGDIVEVMGGVKGLVTKVKGGCYYVIFSDGSCKKTADGEKIKKTGRNADISSYLFGIFGV